jgi:TolB protein
MLILAACGPVHNTGGASCKSEIVFDSDRDGSTEVYVLDLETLEVSRVTDSADPQISNRFPDWSPDGTEVVFVSEDQEGFGQLFSIRLSDTKTRQLTSRLARYEGPAWSPEGNWISFDMAADSTWGLYLIRPDGSELRRVGPEAENLFHSSWSPDGQHLAVVTGSIESWQGGILDLDSGNLRQLVETEAQFGSVAWSPDGSRIAFDGVVDSNFDLYVTTPFGGSPVRLTFGEAIDARPTWSPDGKRLVFHSTRDFGSVAGDERWHEFELYLMDVEDGTVQRLTENASFDAHPDWCPV